LIKTVGTKGWNTLIIIGCYGISIIVMVIIVFILDQWTRQTKSALK